MVKKRDKLQNALDRKNISFSDFEMLIIILQNTHKIEEEEKDFPIQHCVYTIRYYPHPIHTSFIYFIPNAFQ